MIEEIKEIAADAGIEVSICTWIAGRVSVSREIPSECLQIELLQAPDGEWWLVDGSGRSSRGTFKDLCLDLEGILREWAFDQGEIPW